MDQRLYIFLSYIMQTLHIQSIYVHNRAAMFPKIRTPWWDSNPDILYNSGCYDHCATQPDSNKVIADPLKNYH
jgi:hypothetical protein